MDFVALFEPAQDGDGVFNRGLADQHGLEPALERGVLFDVFLVFVERGGADAAQVAPGERGLEHVGSVNRPFGGASPHERVELVYEENDPPIRFFNFLKHRLQAVLELATVFRACN